MNKVWTKEDNELLKKLWGSGITARQIGVRLKRTRGSVIGRANRVGLGTPTAIKVVLETPSPAPRFPLLKNKAGCQFPMGKYPYRYCSKETHAGGSTNCYCEKHYLLCYRGSPEPEKQKVSRPLGWGSAQTRLR